MSGSERRAAAVAAPGCLQESAKLLLAFVGTDQKVWKGGGGMGEWKGGYGGGRGGREEGERGGFVRGRLLAGVEERGSHGRQGSLLRYSKAFLILS